MSKTLGVYQQDEIKIGGFPLLSIFLLAVLEVIVSAPHSASKEGKNVSHSQTHNSESHEIESKELNATSEESGEDDSEYQDTQAEHPTKEKRELLRDNLLRPLQLPETYGIPEAHRNPDFISLYDLLALEGTPVRFQ